MKNAIVIRHIAFENLGSLHSVLQEKGYAIEYLEATPGFLDGINSLTPDLVIILGGPIGAYDEQDYPFLTEELDLLKQRLTNNKPTLGICLGAQLMARALGAKVYPGNNGKEIGWSPIQLTESGENSPLQYLAPEETAVLHWHGDTFDLPDGAVHLAASAAYQNQAFVWGKSALALQFHPEVTTSGLEHWFIGHACEIASKPDVTVGKLRLDTAKYSQKLERMAKLFWQTWLTQVENEQLLTEHSPVLV
ncbi:MAG: glutamine amidotransferase [Okeania sp. SIO1H6]|nr:glutamine amidotransferase [Okeania sp. SIO1H6]